jgi:hypothetical protein
MRLPNQVFQLEHQQKYQDRIHQCLFEKYLDINSKVKKSKVKFKSLLIWTWTQYELIYKK